MDGLNKTQITSFREKFGENRLEEAQKDSWIVKFIKQFNSPIIYVLLIVAFVAAILGEYTDAIVISFVTFFNAIVGFSQELKAENTLAALQKMVSQTAKVRRDGKLQTIDVQEIVPGDIIQIEAGDKVPADGTLISAKNLQINESQLTGESYPVGKSGAASKLIQDILEKIASTEIADKLTAIFKEINLDDNVEVENKVYMSSAVTKGKGTFLVQRTGMATSIGKISAQVNEAKQELTPLEKKFKQLTHIILGFVLFACLLVFLLGIFMGLDAYETFEVAVALGVSVIPEGLPVVVTFTLAIGGWRMAKENAVIRKLNSTSTLAGVQIICTDKTGTITEGHLALERVVAADGLSSEEALLVASICNDAVIDSEGKETGDVLDVAILKELEKQGIDYEKHRATIESSDEIPFDSEYKYMAKLASDGMIYLKGAPEVVLAMCELPKEDEEKIKKQVSELNSNGLRTILVAQGKLPAKQEFKHGSIDGLSFAGILSFVDPIREGVAEVVAQCRAGGLETIMITGDHLDTAKFIAEQAGIYSGDESQLAITGEELKKMNDAELLQEISRLRVIARATPEDKLRLVDAYRKTGVTVAMTGDGVNDAPALAKADIGIAMGITGTDVAKEVADMVLLDDRYATIVRGIEEARVVFDNLRKVISFLFSTSFGEIVLIVVALLIGLPIPLVAAQILWVNLVTDAFLTTAIATEGKESGVMGRKFSNYTGEIVTRFMVIRTIFIGAIMGIGTLATYQYFLINSGEEIARTAALLTIVAFQWFHAFNARSEDKSIFEIGPFSNRNVNLALASNFILQIGAIYLVPMQFFLSTVAVELNVWIISLAVASTVLIMEEIRKLFFRGWKLK